MGARRGLHGRVLLGRRAAVLMAGLLLLVVGPSHASHRSGAGCHMLSAIADFSDDRFLVGTATHVFFGVAGEVAGFTSPDAPGLYEKQQTVLVTERLKGDVEGYITVNFLRSTPCTPPPGASGALPLLDPGREYLFVSMYAPELGWHTLIGDYGAWPVGGPAERAQLRDPLPGSASRSAGTGRPSGPIGSLGAPPHRATLRS